MVSQSRAEQSSKPGFPALLQLCLRSPLCTPVSPSPVPTMALHLGTPERPCLGLLSKLDSPVSPRSRLHVDKETGLPRGATVTSV